MSDPLRERFQQFLREKQLVSSRDRVLVAVSAGIDSMVLLHLFRSCAADLGIEIVAAHFDHAMRAASAQDAEWLSGICSDWQVPLVMVRTQEVLHGEAAARGARYRFLMETLSRMQANRIATAHHADDQIETVLLRLLRGAGLRGLAGIPLRRGPIIRPLLRFRKRELARYALRHQVPFREDETNVSERYARNRIRHMVLPALKSAERASSAEILALARHAARTERLWRGRVRAVGRRVAVRRENGVSELARGILLEYDGETQARVLRAELRRFDVVPDRQATDRMLQFVARADSGSILEVGGGVRIERAFDILRITRVTQPQAERVARIPRCANGRAVAQLGDRHWHVVWTTSPTEPAGESFDCATVRFPLELRSWRAGDRIRMPYGTKKLKKLFAEARIPVHARAAVPILVDAEGRVCWVVGVARSIDALAVHDAPALTIMVTDAENS